LIDAELRFTEFLDILFQADKRCFENIKGDKVARSTWLDEQINANDRKIIRSKSAKSNKRYSLTQAAHLLKVHRQTLYYWIKKSWFKPKRDYRNYPVFTVLDIENIIKWRNSLHIASV